MYIGVDYYPEHWPRARWTTDARLMREAGFNVVRLAEFAWVNMEPTEGQFDFSLFDDALDVLAAEGISAILGTPTAAMPAWVARTYPETLATAASGKQTVWGVRKNTCFCSGTYRLLSERITRAMATHFAQTPNVIGWQTDNEFDGTPCFCGTCRATFQDWLRARYGSLEALNAAWGMHFWGHAMQTWGEIILPDDLSTHNPGLCLDWKRFNSWLNVRFQHEQVEILRAVCPQHFITHNLMSFHPHVNYYDLSADLDFAAWDNYPVNGAPEIRYTAAMAADLMRGVKRKNFWIMETNAGPAGWSEYCRNVQPGEMRSVAYQQIGRGCDGYVWFRWRTCTAGREQYWHGLLGHDGVPGRRYDEAAAVTRELHALWPLLEGTTVPARVAMIYDYDCYWASQIQPGFAGNSMYFERLLPYYSALVRAGVMVDLIPSTADFTNYALVLAPDLYVLPDATAERLNAYVEAGGVLLADCRAAVKTETGLMHDRTLPGLLAPMLGITIPEYEALKSAWMPKEMRYTVAGCGPLAGTYTAINAADWVRPAGADVLAGYSAPWYMTDYAALTKHAFGRGTGYYCGTMIEEPAFYTALVGELLQTAGITPLLTPPDGVEVSMREGDGRRMLFVVNTLDIPQTVTLPAGLEDLLSGESMGDCLLLDRYGVAVLRM